MVIENVTWGVLAKVSIAGCFMASIGWGGEHKGRFSKDFITCAPHEGPTAAAEVKGAQVLRQSASVYSKLRSYIGSTTVHTEAKWENGAQLERRAEAKVTYLAPNSIRIQGIDTGGRSFTILQRGERVWKYWAIQGRQSFKEQPSLLQAIWSVEGVAGGVAKVIPSALLRLRWSNEEMFLPHGQLLEAFASKAELVGTEVVESASCFRIRCEREIGTWEFWIDQESFLLRKSACTESPTQMEIQRKAGGGGTSGKIAEVKSVEHYSVEQMNEPIDPDVFEPRQTKAE